MSAQQRYTYSDINSLADNDSEFVAECEREYNSRLDCAAKNIIEQGKRVIMLAGPSSSGKTTGAKKLAHCFGELGCHAYIVSLDNFYLADKSKYPLDSNGKPDYETVYALDIGLINSSLSSLLTTGLCEIPVYNFLTSRRDDETEKLVLGSNDVVIVEGLHALNPVITEQLPQERLYKIYTSVSTRVYDDDGSVLLTKRDLRLIRRTVRDYQFRSSSVEETLEMWPSVMRGEDKYLFPFSSLSDLKLNSFHPCEPCVLATKAIPLFDAVKQDSAFYTAAHSLGERMKLFKGIDPGVLSPESLLREFTG